MGYRPGTRKTFFEYEETRNKRSIEKDKIIGQFLLKLPIPKPTEFKAMLMPCLWGPEVKILLQRGVPISNLYAIERDRHYHSEMRKKYPGMQLTKRPESFERAVGEFDLNSVDDMRFNLVYLDFYSRPYWQHWKGLKKMARFGMFENNCRLVLNFGRGRSTRPNKEINSLLSVEPAEAYVAIALKNSGYKYNTLFTETYVSKNENVSMQYVTTGMRVYI